MRIEWLNKSGSDRVILFFNGWGMDARAVSHLSVHCDVLMCYDYRSLQEAILPPLTEYREIHVIAWSMGVWAAANLLPAAGIQPDSLIGLNGTEYPVNDLWGIPVRIYQLTERGMSEEGRDKFLNRMFDGVEELTLFVHHKPLRKIEEVCEELCQIRIQSTGLQNTLKWDKIYISDKDVIFPVANQQKWWQERVEVLRSLPGGHYPFYQFESWKQIIGN